MEPQDRSSGNARMRDVAIGAGAIVQEGPIRGVKRDPDASSSRRAKDFSGVGTNLSVGRIVDSLTTVCDWSLLFQCGSDG